MQTSFIDQENSNTSVASHGRLGSMPAGRQVAKTFGSASTPLATPRRALGELSNDPSKKGLSNSTFGKKLLNTGGDGGNIVFKKALPLQMGPVFKKPSMTTPSLQGLTSKKKPLRLKQDGTTKKSATLKMSEMVPSVFEDVFPDVENMHIFDEDKYSSTPRLPDSHSLSKLLDRIGHVRAPLIHHAKKNDTDRDLSHLQMESDSRRKHVDFEEPIISSSSSSLFDLPSSDRPISLHSCLLDLPPLESVDFMDLNNIPDFLD